MPRGDFNLILENNASQISTDFYKNIFAGTDREGNIINIITVTFVSFEMRGNIRRHRRGRLEVRGKCRRDRERFAQFLFDSDAEFIAKVAATSWDFYVLEECRDDVVRKQKESFAIFKTTKRNWICKTRAAINPPQTVLR